ncbi:transcription elongation factor GreA [Tautonia sociabilis]|uniref:Transcription elongation factor GreA n=1 Tax=Tautonia sociabilis TaxID=2080755 RepID=A0A432MDF8_9BACT|nr:transcription elongation factor GreA [Tautonia sociabilis]RUL82519.1 transcription elongation factor GreA [Tautonia sociabilis]
MSLDRIPVSKEGYEKKKAELDHLKNVEMPRITEQVAEARAFGDLSENAEYHAAREKQGELQAKINLLEDQLGRAYIVDRSNLPTDRVVFGSKVKVLDLDLDDEEEFTLVGPGDEDYDRNRILTSSPIGEGLIGKRVGEIAEIAVPQGTIKFKVLEIGIAED